MSLQSTVEEGTPLFVLSGPEIKPPTQCQLWAVHALFKHLQPTLLQAIPVQPNTTNDLDTGSPISYTVGRTNSYTKFTPAGRKGNIRPPDTER